MKELLKISPTQIEISVKKNQQKEKELIGKINPHSGHKTFEINNETLEIEEAIFNNDFAFKYGKNIQNKEILIREGYSYVSALNKKNALKQFLKGKNGSKELGKMKIKLF
jgi:hypothetical protein